MAERYRPLYKLDAGGMAEVYVAEAESVAGFKKKVAIKRILPGLLKDDRFIRMFLDEARLSLYLNHANCVSVFDIGKSESAYFIVMEFIEGTNFKAMIEWQSKRGMQLPPPLVCWCLNEVLKGLDYAHRLRDPDSGDLLQLVHRDISPPNILVSWNGEVKVTDFGLAKASTQLESTDPGVVKGKFSYLAPEAAHGLEVDARADLFAVGIMGWEMLTGKRLFLGETDFQTVEMVRRAEIPSLKDHNENVGTELERILNKALAREPRDRYRTANEFGDDLLAYLFSTGQKFSARDLTAFLATMRAETKKPIKRDTGADLIMKLIDDEILNFRSIEDEGDGGDNVTGSVPLDTLVSREVLSPMPSPQEREVTPSDESLPSGPSVEATPLPQNVPVARPADPRRPSPAPRPELNLGAWLLLVAILVAGGGAYYWLVVLGNLDKLLG